MTEFTAILLAAGLSRRMGVRNKMLLNWHGQPVIRHVARTYLAALGPNVIVVTGYQAGAVRQALRGLDLTFAHNPNFESGQQSSVALGLSHAPADRSILVGLGDQPLLTSQDLVQLMAAHNATDPSKISIPFQDERRGNPVILPARLIPRVLADDVRPGCKRFIDANSHHVQKLIVATPGCFTDIDTPDAYAKHLKGAPYEVSA